MAADPSTGVSKDVGFLAEASPLLGDNDVTFDEKEHKYWVKGVPVALSCTGHVAGLFKEFDAESTIRTYWRRWKSNPRHYLHDAINLALAPPGAGEPDVVKAVTARWERDRDAAASRGTAVHQLIEDSLNGKGSPAPGSNPEVSEELALYYRFLASPFMMENRLRCCRTELPVYSPSADALAQGKPPSCVGMVDALMTSPGAGDGPVYWLVDWKTSKHDLSPTVPAFRGEKGVSPFTCDVPNTHHHKFSWQLSLYAEMLLESRRIDVGDRMYVVRFAPGLAEAQVVPITG